MSDLRSACKKVEEALAAKQLEVAATLLRLAESKLARAASKKVIKKRAAIRKVSRLASKVSSWAKSRAKK